MDTSNRVDSSFRVSIPGTVSPVSQRDTAWRVTWTFSASSSWESPALLRRVWMISWVVIISAPFFLTILPHGAPRGKQPAVAGRETGDGAAGCTEPAGAANTNHWLMEMRNVPPYNDCNAELFHRR